MIKERVPGSIKNKIVATELVEERANCDFDGSELSKIFFDDPEGLKVIHKSRYDALGDPNL